MRSRRKGLSVSRLAFMRDLNLVTCVWGFHTVIFGFVIYNGYRFSVLTSTLGAPHGSNLELLPIVLAIYYLSNKLQTFNVCERFKHLLWSIRTIALDYRFF